MSAAIDYGSPPAVAAATPQDALSAFLAAPTASIPDQLSPGPYREIPSGAASAAQLVSDDGRSTVGVTYGPGGWYVTDLTQCLG